MQLIGRVFVRHVGELGSMHSTGFNPQYWVQSSTTDGKLAYQRHLEMKLNKVLTFEFKDQLSRLNVTNASYMKSLLGHMFKAARVHYN